MPKTNLVVGSIVTPQYLNNINGVDANTGHTHDGTNDDGSVPKIVLDAARDVTGVLPPQNEASYRAGVLAFSVDGGSTFPFTRSVHYIRTGHNTSIKLDPGFGNISLPALDVTAGGILRIRDSSTVWPAGHLGTTAQYSSAPQIFPASSSSSSDLAQFEYISINDHIKVRPHDTNFYDTGTVFVLNEGFSIDFTIYEGE